MTGKAKSRQHVTTKAKSAPSKPMKKPVAAVSKGKEPSMRTGALKKMLMERRQTVLKEIEASIGHRLSDERPGGRGAALLDQDARFRGELRHQGPSDRRRQLRR